MLRGGISEQNSYGQRFLKVASHWLMTVLTANLQQDLKKTEHVYFLMIQIPDFPGYQAINSYVIGYGICIVCIRTVAVYS